MAGKISFDFSDQKIIVTGGSNGIGLSIARAFQAAGADVAITGTRTGLADYPHDLSGLSYHQLRVEDGGAVDAFIGGLKRIDVLVNAAGTALREQEYEPKGFELIMRVNLLGTQRAIHAAFPRLKESNGSVINVASMTSYFGFERVPAYSASKTAIVSLTKSLAAAWAGDGIRINAIAPGWVVTNLTEKARANQELNAAIIKRTPMHRWAQPDEMVGAVLFLCSSAAGFITGITLPVDGGFLASIF
ncbi:MAG: 2-deoxy-D-gluconate 3-dehydrogenase [Spirochaetales bacterium]|nr:2-deoxy-D-gluconate 3-dehydrogenase [Spirochaetales bacterium]